MNAAALTKIYKCWLHVLNIFRHDLGDIAKIDCTLANGVVPPRRFLPNFISKLFEEVQTT